jgi:hypothetical protein
VLFRRNGDDNESRSSFCFHSSCFSKPTFRFPRLFVLVCILAPIMVIVPTVSHTIRRPTSTDRDLGVLYVDGNSSLAFRTLDVAESRRVKEFLVNITDDAGDCRVGDDTRMTRGHTCFYIFRHSANVYACCDYLKKVALVKLYSATFYRPDARQLARLFA